VCSIRRLKVWQQSPQIEVLDKLMSDELFQRFWQHRQVGNWSIRFSISWIQTRDQNIKRFWRYSRGPVHVAQIVKLHKQGVAMTERNTTGPPRAAPWWVTLRRGVLQTTDDRQRRQTPATVTSLAPLHYM